MSRQILATTHFSVLYAILVDAVVGEYFVRQVQQKFSFSLNTVFLQIWSIKFLVSSEVTKRPEPINA